MKSYSLKDFFKFHALFILIAIVFLSLDFTKIGVRILILVIIYQLFFIYFTKNKNLKDWQNIYQFTLPLSIFQVIPDWFLSDFLNVLVFPEDGCFRIGTVAGYMALLWTIPFFMIIFLTKYVVQKFDNQLITNFAILILSLLIFSGSEEVMWSVSWYAQHVKLFWHSAVYVHIPEIILSFSAYYGYQIAEKKPIFIKIVLAFWVMLTYLGALILSFWMLEGKQNLFF